jgi:hypothetical protein
MALSPNYGWAEPDNSSLVKNGAQDIRALGDAIDTSVWNVGFGQAGKNKVINGDFGIWQRGTTFTNPAGDSYTSDRFMIDYGTAAPTSNSVTRQTFTPAAAPVAGYESSFFFRSTLTTVGTTSRLSIHHKIEDVRTYAGQTVTLSFYAKADSARSLGGFIQQNFGSGGSATVSTAITGQSITTAWTRFSMQVAVPSISGKTIGTSSFLNIRLDQAVAAGSVLDIWGLQLEYGAKATPFQTASGGSIQGELAMCQRYYVRFDNASVNAIHGIGLAYDTTNTYFSNQLPVTMRTAPSALEFSALRVSDGVSATNITSASIVLSDRNQPLIQFVVASGLTAFRPYLIQQQSTSGYYGLSAEL